MTPIALENLIVTYLKTDTTLTADAPGGIYCYTELGLVGITREEMPACFDSDGLVLPLVVVKARAPTNINTIASEKERITGFVQFVECWMYQYVGYDLIEIIDNDLHRILHEYKFDGYTAIKWNYCTGPTVDNGALNGASAFMRDFIIRGVKKPV